MFTGLIGAMALGGLVALLNRLFSRIDPEPAPAPSVEKQAPQVGVFRDRFAGKLTSFTDQ